MTSKRKSKPNKRDSKELATQAKPGDDEARVFAETALHPTVQAATSLQQYGAGNFRELDLFGLVGALSAQTKAANEGDLSRAEAMLVAQAHTLDAIFNNLAQRAALNMGEYMEASEKYLKLALRAQSQCRATWEALAAIKNPPVAGYVKQANIAHGPQQVNNAPAAASEAPRGRENANPQNELLEKKDGERLDPGTADAAGRANPAMATLGEVDRAENPQR